MPAAARTPVPSAKNSRRFTNDSWYTGTKQGRRRIVITLTGTNHFARAAALKQLVDEFSNTYPADGVEQYEGEQLTAEVLASAVSGVSLFTQNRFVILHDLAAAKELHEQFSKLVESVPDEVTIVVVEPQLDKRTALYKTLQKQTDFREFAEPSEQELQSWVAGRAKELGGTIDAIAARTLVQYCGADQSRLGNELEKLVAYDATVTMDSIEKLVEPNPADTVFTLLKQALGGQGSRAIQTLLGLESAHEDPFQIASMLVWQAHIMAVVFAAQAAHIQSGEVAKAHKINPFVINKTTRLVGRMPVQKIRAIIERIAELDLQLKTSSYDPWRTIEHTVLAL